MMLHVRTSPPQLRRQHPGEDATAPAAENRALSASAAGGLFEAGWGYGGYSKQAMLQELMGMSSPFEPCYCDWNCHLYEDCCPDFVLVCDQQESLMAGRRNGDDDALLVLENSCWGRCLQQPDPTSYYECYCDDDCFASGDCCDDKILQCL